MADAESIKVALRALEEQMGWADNLARCLAAAAAPMEGFGEPAWIATFGHTIDQIATRVDQLAQAINWSDR